MIKRKPTAESSPITEAYLDTVEFVLKNVTWNAEPDRTAPPKFSVFPEVREHIEDGLKRSWSPEQIVHRQELPVSVSTIYRAIHKDIISRERFWPHLRRKGNPLHVRARKPGQAS